MCDYRWYSGDFHPTCQKISSRSSSVRSHLLTILSSFLLIKGNHDNHRITFTLFMVECLVLFPLFIKMIVTSSSFSVSTVFTPTCSPEHISILKTLKISCCSGTDSMDMSSLTTRVHVDFVCSVLLCSQYGGSEHEHAV